VSPASKSGPRGQLPRPVRAVTFDLGDTLWHFPAPPPREAITQHISTRLHHLLGAWDLRASLTPEELQVRLREARESANRDADAAGGVGPDYVAVTAAAAREAGLDLTPEQASELWQAQNTGGDFLGRTLFEDTIETLDWLRGESIHIAAVTNRTHGGAMFLEELRQDGLLHFFDAVVSSDQCGYRKPHPEIYRIAFRALEVEATETVHVGDHPNLDVLGARRAGCMSVWMRRLNPPDQRPGSEEEIPDAEIHRLSELRELVRPQSSL
jgi:FMN hydrolase / 5-amino-6-(5-phospho-D-ribitylamino)uracil phosphatase